MFYYVSMLSKLKSYGAILLLKLKTYKDRLGINLDNIKSKLNHILKLWNKDLEEYFRIINHKKVPLRKLYIELKNLKNNSDIHKKFILSLWEKDENWEPIYKNIIEDTYRRIENRNKDIDESEMYDAKKLLDEVKLNSINIFKNLIKELHDEKNNNMKISRFRISTLIRILRGDSFCFNTTEDSDPKYIQFDKYVGGKKVKQILQHENSQGEEKDVLISRRHVDAWADLDKMKECLLKYRKFISYYLKETKPYVATETWLNDTEFFKYYSDYLSSQWRNPQDQKTIRNLNLTKELSISGITLLPLTKEWKTYYERRRDFVNDGQSSLSIALRKYEESGKQLQEWMDILDLRKIN